MSESRTEYEDKISEARRYDAKGLAFYYNLILRPRGIELPPHLVPVVHGLADRRILNLMLLIGPGCLTGDTIVGWERSAKTGLRNRTLEELYHKFNGIPWYTPKAKSERLSRPWDLAFPTRTLSWTGDRVAMNEIVAVHDCGVKPVFRLTVDDGSTIKATEEHPFLVSGESTSIEEFKTLATLNMGDVVCMRETNSHKGGRKKRPARRVTYSIPFHPYGQRNFVYGRDYKRLPTARLILEADLNGLSLDEFIWILRTDEARARTLKYISPEFEIHHKDDDYLNDVISNLEPVAFKEHLAIHAYDKQKNFGNVLTKEAVIKSIEYVGEERTYDIVMAEPYRNYVANNFIVHNSGKSLLLTEIFPSWSLGHDPTLTVIGVSAGENLIQGFLRSVMEIIEWSPIWRALFPRVRPDKSAGWSSDRGLFVTGRDLGNSDASYAAFGLDSKVLTGKHAKLLIFDDLHDKENSATEDQCDKVWSTYNNTLIGRADPGGARFIIAGRRWSKNDIYQHLIDTGEFVVMTLPAERERTNKLWIDIQLPDDLTCCFTESVQNDDI